jgi:hypothetical protein
MTTALEQTVVRILNDPVTQAIRFTWNGTTIANIDSIAALIPGRIAVDLVPPGPRTRPVDHYATQSNRLSVFRDPGPPAGTIADEATVVHEAVHALLDRASFGGDDMDAEAMGYIAQGWYHLGKNSVNPDSGSYHRLGRQVAEFCRQNPRSPIPAHYRTLFYQCLAVSSLYQHLVDREHSANGTIVSTRNHGYNGIPNRRRAN